MAFTSADWLVMFVFGVSMGLTLGFILGSRRALRDKRKLQRDVNRAELKALDHYASTQHLRRLQHDLARRERLQRLLLRRLKHAESRVAEQMALREEEQRRHFVQTAKMRLLATRMQQRAERASSLARRATARLKCLEKIARTKRSASATRPTSTASAEPRARIPTVTEKHTPSVCRETLSAVSYRDSERLSRMQPSNEDCRLQADNLQAIRGIDTTVEKSLNAAGIHRIEQLACMNEHELQELESRVERPELRHSCSEWALGARRLLRQSERS